MSDQNKVSYSENFILRVIDKKEGKEVLKEYKDFSRNVRLDFGMDHEPKMTPFQLMGNSTIEIKDYKFVYDREIWSHKEKKENIEILDNFEFYDLVWEFTKKDK